MIIYMSAESSRSRDGSSPAPAGGSATRGVSSVLGVILVLSMVVMATAIVVTVGAVTFQQSQSTVTMESAVTAMEELNSDIRTVASESDQQAGVTMPSMEGADLRFEETGWINVSVERRFAGTLVENRTTGRLDFGKIVYEQDEQAVAIQGGGVWRTNRGGGVAMVAAPPFTFQNERGGPALSLPVISLDGNRIDDGTVTADGSGSMTDVLGDVNPVRYSQQINVTVESEFYRGWARLFESRTGGEVRTDNAENRATLILHGPDLEYELGNVHGAVLSPVGAGYPENGNLIDSYDSQHGSYSTSQGTDAFVGIDGPFVPGNAVTIKGDLYSAAGSGGGEISNSPEIWGETRLGGDVAIDNAPQFGRDSDPGTDGFSTTGNMTSVSSDAVFDGNVIVGGHVYNGDINTDGFGGHATEDVSVGDGARLASGARVDGRVTVGDDLVVRKDVDIGGAIHADGTVRFTHQASYLGPAVTATDDVILESSGATVDASVNTTGNVTLAKKGRVVGTVRANGTISLGSQTEIDGDVYVPGGNSSVSDPSKVTGTIHDVSNVSVSVPEPVEPPEPRIPPLGYAPATELIEAKWFDLRQPIADENPSFTADACSGTGCELTLGMGQYNASEFHITDDETVTFDTTEGDIELYVEHDVRIEQGNHVDVVGNGTVTLYVNGTSGHEDVFMRDVTVGNVTTHDSTALRVLTRPAAHAAIAGDTDFVGVIYGPGSPAIKGTDFALENQAEVFGAVVGNFAGPDAHVSNDVEIHYDRTLGRLADLRSGDWRGVRDPATVKYLRLAVGDVTISG